MPKECTFRPQIHAASGVKPKNLFDLTVLEK